VGWRGIWAVYCGNFGKRVLFRLWSLIPRDMMILNVEKAEKLPTNTEAWKGRGVVS
jgi:hypothetical protein